MIDDHDISEIDALDTLVNSDGWKLVVERIGDLIELRRDELEGGRGEVAAHRGWLSALRIILTLPSILKAEYEAEAKK